MNLIDYNFYSFPVAFFNLIAYNRIRIKKSVKIFHFPFIWLTNSPIICCYIGFAGETSPANFIL